ncbi:hypothetical protein QWY31_11815 [Cytophagales bacterium LB-30]|uniref:Uncharacterized protein n=1 Tax=Shiella aurantiaca TaxID=3058365 RepID=A0ABT8F7I6_9BACT|nr:hypothetical protein [Shiella aurantiaca]MDN4166194.1 hypothetical protein [Shiella aurantiaca]
MSLIAQLSKNVANLSTEINYWFVRTDYGDNFDTYYENGFIAIGWNYITLQEIQGNDLGRMREKILKNEKFDPDAKRTKGKITGIINKLINFVELKKGDVVVIPSRNSSRYAFGIIEDDKVYTVTEPLYKCEHYKRRKVKWLEAKNMNDLDPHFYRMRLTQHSISKINDYSQYIDNVVRTLYVRDNSAHFVLDIKTEEDINVDSLLSLIQSFKSLSVEINSHFKLNEDIGKYSIKLNLQSPGQIEFKLPYGRTLIILALLVNISCGGNKANNKVEPELDKFIKVHQKELTDIKKTLEDLEADKDKINSL